jgi:hypothetical protein
MDTQQTQQHDEGEPPTGDLLVGGDAIETYLISLGMPETVDAYYLRKIGWPIGKLADGQSAPLVASKRRLGRHAQRRAALQKTPEAAA